MRCIALWMLFLTVLLPLSLPQPLQGDEPGTGGTVLYASMVPADRDLYAVEDGRARALTRLPGLEYHAAPTPDGRSIVFTSEQGGDPDLWIVDVDSRGAEPRLLYDSDALEDAADVSPDGRHIAFVSTRSGRAEIWLADFPPENPRSFDQARLLTPQEGSDFRPAFSPDGRWIAYSSTRGLEFSAGSHVWIVGVDPALDGGSRRIVNGEGWNGSPVWSRDGRSVAFHRLVPYANDHPDLVAEASVWEVDVESGDQRRLSAEGRFAAYPARHPEGDWVWAEKEDGNWSLRRTMPDGELATLPADVELAMPALLGDGRVVGHGPGGTLAAGADGIRLMPMLPPIFAREQAHVLSLDDRWLGLLPLRAAFPALSPDEATLATGAMSLMQLDVRTGSLVGDFRPDGLAETFPSVWAPSWSPDGTWLAFTGGPGFGAPDASVDVWRVGADGNGAVNLTANSTGNDALPEVSPDGRWIVFRSGRSGQQDLYLMDSDGSNVRRLTEDPAVDTMPAFSPDGRHVAFASTRSGNHDVFVLPLDEQGRPAGEPEQITTQAGMDVHPRWSPDGRWLTVTTDRWGWNDELDFVALNFQPYGEVAAVRLSDGRVVRLTFNNWEEAQGEWVEAPLVDPGSTSSRSPRGSTASTADPR